MKVRAKDVVGQVWAGYYDHRRIKAGDEFEISSPQHFSERWMEYVDGAPTIEVSESVAKEEEAPVVFAEAQREPTTYSELGATLGKKEEAKAEEKAPSDEEVIQTLLSRGGEGLVGSPHFQRGKKMAKKRKKKKVKKPVVKKPRTVNYK